jgi:Flp pilus assembly protein TadD
MVEMYAARAQWDKAIAVVQREADAFPQSPELRRLLATTCGRAGSYDLAIEQFRKLQQMQPAPDIPLQLGLLYDAKGQFDQALTEFQTARQMNAKDPLPPAMLGKVFEQTLRWPEAVANYRESIRLDPGNASVLNNLAFALSENNGDLGEALQMARRAIDKNPGNLEFNDTLGWVYLKKKDIPSALQVFRNIRQKEPGNATFRIHLAMAYKESGDRGAARQELTAAGQLHPSTQEGLQIKQLLERIENP